MRSLAFVVCALALIGCDLKPGKPRDHVAGATPKAAEPADPGPANPSAPDPEPLRNPLPPNAGFVDAGVRPPPMETTEQCTNVAVHITNLVIASIEDPSLKAAQEQDRTRMVRRVAETCTRDKWSDAAVKCFFAGKTTQEVESCGRNLAAPAPE